MMKILILGATPGDYTIYIATSPGSFTELDNNMPLDAVNEKYWKVNKPLEMFFSSHKQKTEDTGEKL